MTENFSARSVEEAKQAAADKFGCDVSCLEFEVIQEPSNGFLGIGKKEAVIKASKKDDNSAQNSRKEILESLKEAQTETFDNKSENLTAVQATEAAEATGAAEAAEKSDKETTSKHFVDPADILPMEENIENVKNYITEVASNLGVKEISIESTVTGDGVLLNLSCDDDNKGTLIGKRGDVLDALQYLSSVILNRHTDDYVRLTIDTNGYRDRRRATLESLASKIAKQVLRTGRSNTLEPMNPYERRIIHQVISETEGVSSHSVGEEPYRKVVITSDNPRPRRKDARGGNGGRGGRSGRSGRGGRGGSYNRNGNGSKDGFSGKKRYYDDDNYVPKPKSMDSLKTSFEKDYSKPKPEDDINGGLYGKIDI